MQITRNGANNPPNIIPLIPKSAFTVYCPFPSTTLPSSCDKGCIVALACRGTDSNFSALVHATRAALFPDFGIAPQMYIRHVNGIPNINRRAVGWARGIVDPQKKQGDTEYGGPCTRLPRLDYPLIRSQGSLENRHWVDRRTGGIVQGQRPDGYEELPPVPLAAGLGHFF